MVVNVLFFFCVLLYSCVLFNPAFIWGTVRCPLHQMAKRWHRLERLGQGSPAIVTWHQVPFPCFVLSFALMCCNQVGWKVTSLLTTTNRHRSHCRCRWEGSFKILKACDWGDGMTAFGTEAFLCSFWFCRHRLWVMSSPRLTIWTQSRRFRIEGDSHMGTASPSGWLCFGIFIHFCRLCWIESWLQNQPNSAQILARKMMLWKLAFCACQASLPLSKTEDPPSNTGEVQTLELELFVRVQKTNHSAMKKFCWKFLSPPVTPVASKQRKFTNPLFLGWLRKMWLFGIRYCAPKTKLLQLKYCN